MFPGNGSRGCGSPMLEYQYETPPLTTAAAVPARLLPVTALPSLLSP